jgi:hypothetical protein
MLHVPFVVNLMLTYYITDRAAMSKDDDTQIKGRFIQLYFLTLASG